MGVYIESMDFPYSCYYCPMREWHIVYGEKINFCKAAKELIKDEDGRPDWCPLTELPPHGESKKCTSG